MPLKQLRVVLLACSITLLLGACSDSDSPSNGSNDKTRPLTITSLASYTHGAFDKNATELSAYDANTRQLFAINADSKTVDILDISDPTTPIAKEPLQLSGKPTSLAVKNSVLAVVVKGSANDQAGELSFFGTEGSYPLLSTVSVGMVPAMVLFTPDGKTALVANEAEPLLDKIGNFISDAEASISIVRFSEGVSVDAASAITQDNVVTADFTAFNPQKSALIAAGVRIYGDPHLEFGRDAISVAQDVEPEYIAVSSDSKTAWVTLQENNALAILDIQRGVITEIKPLGLKDHNLQGQGLDASDDQQINIANWPVYGLYGPDAVVAFDSGDETYLLLANEGDERKGEVDRVSDLELDPEVFPDWQTLQQDENLGRLFVSSMHGRYTADGFGTDDDNEHEKLLSYGGRSFSIRDSAGELVYDSGDLLEQIIATQYPKRFNTDNDSNKLDIKSDEKGPEPEGAEVGVIDDRVLGFVAAEDMGGFFVFDITEPAAPEFLAYHNDRDFSAEFNEQAEGYDREKLLNLGPEGLHFIPAADSPNGENLLVVSYEIGGNSTIYQINYRRPL